MGGFVTTTETMKALYASVSVPGIPISNVPYLSRIPKNSQSDKNADITIVTSGTNSTARNCLQTIRAIPMVVRKYPHVRFKFLGMYSPAGFDKTLRDLANELGVNDNVDIEGMVPWLENFKRVGKCHIGCVFYEDNLNNLVTIPNRIFEYMSMGLAIIGEDFPEVKKVVDKANCGITVDSSKPELIANGIIAIIEHPDGIKKLGDNGRKAVDTTYNFEKELNNLAEFYRQINLPQK